MRTSRRAVPGLKKSEPHVMELKLLPVPAPACGSPQPQHAVATVHHPGLGPNESGELLLSQGPRQMAWIPEAITLSEISCRMHAGSPSREWGAELSSTTPPAFLPMSSFPS